MKPNFGLPEIASAHGAALDEVTIYTHWLMVVMFIGWGALFLYMLYRFRAGKNPKASYEGTHGSASKYVEVGIVVAEAVLLIGFSIPLWSERVDNFPSEEDSTTVRVVGEQFAWNVHYPGPDGMFGRSDVSLIDAETNPLGLDASDPMGKDDITTINQLHLPVDKPTIVHLTTKDVIHSFGITEMRIKQDAMPGISIPLWFTPTVTSAEMAERVGNPDFQYEVGCYQLCGLGHYRMKGFVTIHTQEAFDQWLAEQAPSEDEGEGSDFWN